MTSATSSPASIPGGDEAGGAGHTPGPWGVEFGTYTLWVGPNQSGRVKLADVVVSMDYGPNYRPEFYARQKANARLIAAAPELLEAAREMLVLVLLKYGNLDADVNKAVERAQSAIAKAVGDVKRDADPIHRRDGAEGAVNDSSLPSQSEVG